MYFPISMYCLQRNSENMRQKEKQYGSWNQLESPKEKEFSYLID